MEFYVKFWIRPNKALRNISFLAFGLGKPVERKGEEKKKKRREEEEIKVWNVWNFCMEYLVGIV